MSEGDAFGELALLHNIRRTATIICKQNSEFLRVDKPDFDEVSKYSKESLSSTFFAGLTFFVGLAGSSY